MNRYFVTSYENFRNMAKDDAYAWSQNGYKADELSNDDIINEYGNDFISQLMTEEDAYKELNLHDDTYGVFSLDDLCEKTRDYLQDIC